MLPTIAPSHNKPVLSFTDIFSAWKWRSIHGCPGRYVLREAPPNLSPSDLAQAEETTLYTYRVVATPDEVIVVPLEEGGLISYHRPDDSYLHTLNTPDGFQRKLLQLGILWPPAAK